MAEKSHEGRKRIGRIVGAATIGVGAGLALEKYLVGRLRFRPDEFETVPYGQLPDGRRYEVESADGATIVAEDFGPPASKAGLIFLHGYCLDRTIWHHQVSTRPVDLRHVTYDARHHGLSHGGSQDIDIKTLASDLFSVINKSGLEKVVLVGHSMGGMTVLEFCRQHETELRGRVKGMVLVNTTYTDAVATLFAAHLIGPVERRLRTFIEALLRDPRSARVMRLRADDLSWLLVRYIGFGTDASPAQVEYTRRLLTRFPTPELISVLKALREFDTEDSLEAIDLPTLIIAGGKDRITTIKASDLMSLHIPNARLHVIPEAGHMSMMERADEFNSLIEPFVRQALLVAS